VTHGAKLNVRYPCKVNEEERVLTPFLYLVASRVKNTKVLQWYLDHGSNINEVEEKTGHDALYFSIINNSKNLVKFIISKPDFDKKRVDAQG
jgi:hypothetical protein